MVVKKKSTKKKETDSIYMGSYALSAKNDTEAIRKRDRADKRATGVSLGYPKVAATITRPKPARITPKRPKLRR